MYDEDGRKIETADGLVPLNLETLSVASMNHYIAELQQEIKRVEAEISQRGSMKSAAESFFKPAASS